MNQRIAWRVIAISALALVVGGGSVAMAQETPKNGDICISAFADQDGSGSRQTGESALSDVDIELAVNSTVIIANYVTNGNEPYCFRALLPGQYTVRFNSPNYASGEALQLSLTAGGRINREVGMVAKAQPVSKGDSTLFIPLTVPNRIIMALISAVLSMSLTAAVGLIVYGVFLHHRKSKSPYAKYGKLKRRGGKRSSAPAWDRGEVLPPEGASRPAKTAGRGKQPISFDDEYDSGFDEIEWKKPDA